MKRYIFVLLISFLLKMTVLQCVGVYISVRGLMQCVLMFPVPIWGRREKRDVSRDLPRLSLWIVSFCTRVEGIIPLSINRSGR